MIYFETIVPLLRHHANPQAQTHEKDIKNAYTSIFIELPCC